MNAHAIIREQWRRPAHPKVSLHLPFPPSVNALWKRGKTGMYRSPRYMGWLNEAGKELELQRPGMIEGSYVIAIELERKEGRRRDADNLAKAIGDLLTAHGVIEDDSLAEAVVILWSPKVKGCRVALTAVRRPE